MQGTICPDQESVVELRVDSYKSTRSTGLRYIGYLSLTYLYMTPHISICNSALISTTSLLIRNEPLEHERTVVCLATRNEVSCRSRMTIDYRDPTTNTNLKIMHVVFVLGLIAVIDLIDTEVG